LFLLTLREMAEVKYYSEEGLQKLKEELKQLTTIERPAISAAIAEARDKGDLSENAEYDAAKEAQGLLETRIANLQTLIANARLLDESKLDTSKVLLLSKVEFENLALKKKMVYEIVPESEANLKEGKISVTSPIAKGLLGRKVGEIAEIVVPVGTMKVKITKITR
jgi:transcription elongation factor GreA